MLPTVSKIAAVSAALACLAGCRAEKTVQNPQEVILEAWNDYRMGEFNRAQTRFEAVAASAEPGSDFQLQAWYGLATTWNLRRPGENTRRAEEIYGKIVETAPNHDLAAWSLLALARMKHLVPVGQEPDYPEVRKAYQKVIDRFPYHLAGEEAFVYQQATLLLDEDTQKARQAAESVERFVREHSTSRFLSPAYGLLSRACDVLKEYDKKLAASIRSYETTDRDPTNPKAELSGTYWNIAVVAEFDVGDFDTARAFYRKLIEEYPKDQRVHPVRQALKRMDEIESRIRAEQAAIGKEAGT